MGKRFGLVLHSPPGHEASLTAFEAAEAIIRQGHQLVRVFLQDEGVLHVHSAHQPEANAGGSWISLCAETGTEIVACVTSAQSFNLIDQAMAKRAGKAPTLLPPAIIGGLGTFAESVLDCDVVLTFGKGAAS